MPGTLSKGKQMNSDQVIPAELVQFCKEVARLAAQYELSRLNMTFNPGFNTPWRDAIQMAWDSGRHGDNAHRLNITSTVMVQAEVG